RVDDEYAHRAGEDGHGEEERATGGNDLDAAHPGDRMAALLLLPTSAPPSLSDRGSRATLRRVQLSTSRTRIRACSIAQPRRRTSEAPIPPWKSATYGRQSRPCNEPRRARSSHAPGGRMRRARASPRAGRDAFGGARSRRRSPAATVA